MLVAYGKIKIVHSALFVKSFCSFFLPFYTCIARHQIKIVQKFKKSNEESNHDVCYNFVTNIMITGYFVGT